MNTRTQPGTSGDLVRLTMPLSLGALGVKGESGACDLKLRDSGKEPEVEPREALNVAFLSIWA